MILKLCPQARGIYLTSLIDVGPAILEPWRFENVDTAWMHACTDGHLTGFVISHLGRDD